jgi:hypothetical protein
LALQNDYDFWPANFDKYSFENQRCSLYSYNKQLEPSDARLIFKGRVQKKAYAPDKITFSLSDQFSELRATIDLETIGSLEERTGDDVQNAKQRLILGRVFGHVPMNIDRVLEGYPVTGTVSISFGDLELVGTGTQFLAELSPDDSLLIDGVEYTVASVETNTSLTLSSEYENVSAASNV